MKKIYLSKKNKVLGGVCGGMAEYFNLDPVIIRIIFVVLVIGTGFFPFIIGYILAYVMLSEPPVKRGGKKMVEGTVVKKKK